MRCGGGGRGEAFWINEGVENIYIYVSKTNSFFFSPRFWEVAVAVDERSVGRGGASSHVYLSHTYGLFFFPFLFLLSSIKLFFFGFFASLYLFILFLLPPPLKSPHHRPRPPTTREREAYYIYNYILNVFLPICLPAPLSLSFDPGKPNVLLTTPTFVLVCYSTYLGPSFRSKKMHKYRTLIPLNFFFKLESGYHYGYKCS